MRISQLTEHPILESLQTTFILEKCLTKGFQDHAFRPQAFLGLPKKHPLHPELQSLHTPLSTLPFPSPLRMLSWNFPAGLDGKESACNAVDLGSIPGLGRSSEEGNGYPLQYSILKNFMDTGAWGATVHEVTKSWIQLRD